MADTKYTPGPWKATARRVSKPETEDRLALDVQINGGNRDDNKANARLIAAAPDMLAVLQAFVAEQESHQGLASVTTYADAVRAITKATGST